MDIETFNELEWRTFILSKSSGLPQYLTKARPSFSFSLTYSYSLCFLCRRSGNIIRKESPLKFFLVHLATHFAIQSLHFHSGRFIKSRSLSSLTLLWRRKTGCPATLKLRLGRVLLIHEFHSGVLPGRIDQRQFCAGHFQFGCTRFTSHACPGQGFFTPYRVGIRG